MLVHVCKQLGNVKINTLYTYGAVCDLKISWIFSSTPLFPPCANDSTVYKRDSVTKNNCTGIVWRKERGTEIVCDLYCCVQFYGFK